MEQIKTKQTDPSFSGCRCAKVLLIDDNPLDNFVNRKLIETNRFAAQVLAYESAVEALEYLKNETFDELPDLIFLDIMMPKIDGFRFLEEFEMLKPELHSRIKIIMLSTSESFKDLNRANKNRFVYKFLNKPLTEQVLNAISI